MTALTFQLREPLPDRLDASPLVPEQLQGLMVDQVRFMKLRLGPREVTVGELFDVERGSDGREGETIRFVGGDPNLDRVGAGLTGGRVVVNGPVGAFAGERAQRGAIDIYGDAGAYAGTSMSGGNLRIQGSAGDYAGGAWPGARHGLRGGRIHIGGDCGARAGYRMRRGEILVAGDAGPLCGGRMIAGTIAVAGHVGTGVGYAMRRGTLLVSEAPETSAVLADCGYHEPVYLMVMVRGWQNMRPSFRFHAPIRYTRRLVGDRSVGGDGEILFPGR